jgi:hypothetical protein
MSDVVQPDPQPTFFQRMRHTPLRDAIRGRLSGRLDVKRLIESSALPQVAKDLIRRVVKRTRLWRAEKIDVANELISHFGEGIASGETIEELIRSFGDERQAAKLVRRAKRRNRPLAWKMFRVAGLALAALLVIYCAIGVYYFIGHATPSVNYLAEINRSALSAPENQRAWPVYRKAILGFGFDRSKSDFREIEKITNAGPGNTRWPETAKWLSEHADAIDLLRRGASRPTLGFVYGASGSICDPELWPGHQCRGDDNDPVMCVLLPHLHDLANANQILEADAKAARAAGERVRLLRDIVALNQMGVQIGREEFLITQLIALSMRQRALTQIEQTLLERPELFTDADLRDLAHQFAQDQNATDLFHLAGERKSFYDAMQRVYTDDGHGDGRLTAEGFRKLTTEWANAGTTAKSQEPLEIAGGPAVMLLVDSRKETLDLYDSFMNTTEAELAKPLREARHVGIERRIQAMANTLTGKLRHMPVMMLTPTLVRTHKTAEQFLGRRDGVLTGIALELHRRHAGTYPMSLNELVPALLPSVPSDRFTGQPIRYKLVDGKPLIYSFGADLNDDDGRMPHNDWGVPQPEKAASWPLPSEKPADGDWILFPESPKPRPTTSPDS